MTEEEVRADDERAVMLPEVNQTSPRSSSVMRRILYFVLFVVVVQVLVLVFIFDVDFQQVHHVARSWHQQIFGDKTQVPREVNATTIDSSSTIPSMPSAAINSSFIRAAVVYLPTGLMQSTFESQFRWFRRSWIEMQKYEPENWRTDVVVYSDGPLPLLESLGCDQTNRRTDRIQPNRCILINNYTSLYSPSFPYRFADSVNVLALDNAVLESYDWVLRTDIDTFLTPAFSTWQPPIMVVGQGAYSFPGYSTADRLASIMEKLQMAPMTINNVGSTWFGPTNVVRTCANLSVAIMHYLYENEFTEEEKSPEYGVKGWPNWHIGVISMYSGHIAINNCTKESGVTKNNGMLDFPTSSAESTKEHAHLHTWQDQNRFSKFVFQTGGYASENKSLLNLDIINDYAMYMALDSHEST